MNKENFSFWVVNPNEVNALDIPALEQLVAAYPYCQLGYALLAKGHFEVNNNDQATAKLRNAAAYALSRNSLRKLLNGEFKGGATGKLSAKSYSRYLKSQQKNQTTDNQPVTIDVNPLQALRAIDYSETLLSNESQIIAEQPTLPLSENVQKNQADIIDKFIQNEPRIRPLRSKSGEDLPEPTEDLASKATVPSLKLITESFAKIQAKQGKIDKAIEIYEQLILKNPEKKSYFAAKIEELKR